ncbi:hypothetical protein NW762_012994 [Fusarium torreyae]|uniref:DUF6604 domain-containing protein n=1 Tax=Fusarium torreyae TaxID=1237075 RepID=A0A9W8RLF3_9HYPO|nr:hypothetical protein NW762_012994 [Fusarium torreyae]
MLPTPLVGAVQRYKEDTNSVAAWLASTAKLCGFRSDLHTTRYSNNENQKTSGRLKGKARTEAKNSHVPTEKATTTKYTVALDDFVPMAEFIAACRKPVISVPACFVSTLDRVIRVRSTFKGRMTEHGIETDEKSDKAHSYFVDILEKVRNILGPRIPPNVSERTPAASDTDKPTKGFNILPLFEPSQEFLEAPNIERPCKTSNDATIYEAESHESFEDDMVTWFLMLTDADNIRQHIKWAWEGYRDGTFDLTSAAVATNVGIQLVRKMAEQFEPIKEKHGCDGLKEFIDTHFFTCAIALGFSNHEILKWQIDGIDDNLFALADRTFWSAACWMSPLASRCHGPALWALCSDSFSCRTLQGDRDAKSNEEKFDEDRAILVQLWGETVLFCKYVDDFPVEGEFNFGFRKVNKMKRGHKFITFQMVFAAQIHLDVHHILREKATDAFQIFKHQVMTMREQLDEYDKLKEVCPGWCKQYTDLDERFQAVHRALDSSLNDKVYKIKLSQHAMKGGRMQESRSTDC